MKNNRIQSQHIIKHLILSAAVILVLFFQIERVSAVQLTPNTLVEQRIYNYPITIVFSEGSATLNDLNYESGQVIEADGDYVFEHVHNDQSRRVAFQMDQTLPEVLDIVLSKTQVVAGDVVDVTVIFEDKNKSGSFGNFYFSYIDSEFKHIEVEELLVQTYYNDVSGNLEGRFVINSAMRAGTWRLSDHVIRDGAGNVKYPGFFHIGFTFTKPASTEEIIKAPTPAAPSSKPQLTDTSDDVQTYIQRVRSYFDKEVLTERDAEVLYEALKQLNRLDAQFFMAFDERDRMAFENLSLKLFSKNLTLDIVSDYDTITVQGWELNTDLNMLIINTPINYRISILNTLKPADLERLKSFIPASQPYVVLNVFIDRDIEGNVHRLQTYRVPITLSLKIPDELKDATGLRLIIMSEGTWQSVPFKRSGELVGFMMEREAQYVLYESTPLLSEEDATDHSLWVAALIGFILGVLGRLAYLWLNHFKT